MASFLSRIFGSGYEPMTVEQTEKHVAADLAAIIREQEKLKALPDIGLRQQTEELINIVKNHLIEIDSKMNTLREKMAPDSDADVAEKAEMALELEQLQQRRFEASGKILDQLLPRAFAIVRETARRWKDNGQLEVPMSEYDREMLGKYYGLHWQTEEDLEDEDTIDLSESTEDQEDFFNADIEESAEEEKEPPVPLPDTAVWLNTWPVLDARPTWKMEHYPSQLTAGIMLHKGKISELDNGEGKTLVATLPAYLNALSGSGVHISTANPYLARRDAAWMGPLFAFLGFQTHCLENTRPNSPERRYAYEADITYGTIREFAFDYLRDNTAERLEDQVISRQPHVLILDEIDYILIDEARNSITISGDLPEEQCLIPKELYSDYNAMVVEMVEEQHAIIDRLIQDIQPLIPKSSQMTEDPVGECANIVRTGAPHYEKVNQFLLQDRVEERRARTIRVWEQMPERKLKLIEETLLYNMEGTPTLTESGKAFISERMLEQYGEENFFDLPDIIDQLRDIHSNTAYITNEVLERKEELVTSYKTRNERIKVIDNLLNAHANKYEGKEYVVVPEHTWSNTYCVKIIDETTGRLMEGSRYSSGLHQALEAKHGLEIGNFTKPFATITIQNYCLQYPKLCGMSATAHFDAREYWEIYKLQIAAIRPNAPSKRQDKHNNPKYRDQVYKTRREKYNAVLEHIIQYAQNGRPVLVGAASVFESDYLSQLLHRQGIPHQLLNALQHQDEAHMIAAAGYPGMITISTNMAGRGTDILLTPEAIQYGGLAVLGVERHEARRLDYQLSGRAGRQGNPGSAQFFLSLEDHLMMMFQGDKIAKLMDAMGHKDGDVVQAGMVDASIDRAQRKVEEHNYINRSRLYEYDSMLNRQREMFYQRRTQILRGERLEYDITNTIRAVCEQVIKDSVNTETLKAQCRYLFRYEPDLAHNFKKLDLKGKVDDILWPVFQLYNRRCKEIADGLINMVYNIQTTQGRRYNKVVVPYLTHNMGTRRFTASIPKALNSGGLSILPELTQQAYVYFMDEAWKDHLADIDDLREDVGNMQHTQKVDPVLLFKAESLTKYEELLGSINIQVVRFIFTGELYLPEQEESTDEPKQTEQDSMSNLRKLQANRLRNLQNNEAGNGIDGSTGPIED